MTDRHPSVVLSYGLGVDSTAILLRWLNEPASRDFDLDDLLVVTAHTGNEWPDTVALVEEHILPLLAKNRIRYAQVARAGASKRDGYVLLSDTRRPDRLVTSGGYTLAENLLSVGTVPQSAGDRRHSVNFKGFPLDKFIAVATGGRPYRHAVGFEMEETDRADRDRRYATATRTPAYPLIEWEWTRVCATSYIRDVLGVDWPKSACTYCPFALNPSSLPATLARFSDHPEEAVLPLLMEHAAVCMNPRQGLIGGRRLITVMRRTPAAAMAVARFDAELAASTWAVYQVQRARLARRIVRRVTVQATGTQAQARAALEELAVEAGIQLDETDEHPRLWHRRPALVRPTAEWFFTVAPAVVEPKTGPAFADAWAAALTGPAQPALLDQKKPA